MGSIKSMFAEVRLEMIKVLLINVILEAAILFLSSYLVFSIFSAPIWYSGIITFVFSVVRFLIQSRHLNLKKIEERNPSLREMLRTANDNIDDNSLMAHALFHEVMAKMRRVSSGTFLDFDKVVKRIGVIFILSMILISLAFFNINVAKFSNPLEKPLHDLGKWIGDLTGSGSLESQNVDLADDSLYGAPSMADLSNEELNLKINPSLNQVDFSKVQDPDTSTDTIKDFPGEARAVKDSSYAGGLDDAIERKTAAEYSQKIKD